MHRSGTVVHSKQSTLLWHSEMSTKRKIHFICHSHSTTLWHPDNNNVRPTVRGPETSSMLHHASPRAFVGSCTASPKMTSSATFLTTRNANYQTPNYDETSSPYETVSMKDFRRGDAWALISHTSCANIIRTSKKTRQVYHTKDVRSSSEY